MTEDYYLEKSNDDKHKFMVSFITDSGRLRTLRFGAKGMSDYTIHKDKERKDKYEARHKKNEDWTDLTKRGTWAKYILWNKPSLKGSIKDMEKHFNIKIHYIE